MKLTEFEHQSKVVAERALKEHFGINLDVERMNIRETAGMLKRVRGLMQETKRVPQYYGSKNNASYMKLTFMEHALRDHYNTLLQQQRQTRIVLENEAVEEAQVTLAAQDLCNSVQKMLKDVGKMQVEELPALVDGIESEIGVNESKAYEEAVSAQLDTLSNALKEAFQALKGARDALTGGEGAEFSPEGGEEDMGGDMGGMPGEEPGGMPPVEAPAPEMPEEPTEEPTPSVGRSKR
jgi:hypothetical protein